jgi:uncharacterized protein YodC (DUF2158 family)
VTLTGENQSTGSETCRWNEQEVTLTGDNQSTGSETCRWNEQEVTLTGENQSTGSETCRWNEQEVTLTGENQSTGSETCFHAPLSTTNVPWTGPESKMGLRSDRPVTNCPSYGTAL